jgi:mono/diheme cytochrome c family protein
LRVAGHLAQTTAGRADRRNGSAIRVCSAHEARILQRRSADCAGRRKGRGGNLQSDAPVRRRRARERGGRVIRRAAASIAMMMAGIACCPGPPRETSLGNPIPVDADPQRGREVIERFGCGGCHVIPGIAGAVGLDGPPLLWFARRGHVAGVLPNTFDNVVSFLQSPQSIHPGSAMPAPDLGRHQAGDVVAYLYTLH